jgi:concanavalin A-like lectin/glucanase superfamily protein
MRRAALLVLAACGRLDFDPVPDGITGLVARYPMDDDPSSGTCAATDPSLDGTCTACPSPTAGKIAGAYSFDGTGPMCTLPAISTTFAGAAPFTITAWIRTMPVTSIHPTIVAKPLDATTTLNAISLWVYQTTREANFETSFAGLASIEASPTVVTDFAWHHVAGSWDGNLKTLFVDGMPLVATPAGFADSSLPIVIGADIDTGMPTGFFEGDLDDVRFYSRALAPDEVAVLAAP